MKISILGLAKSGTSAIYKSILTSLEKEKGEAQGYFEPKTLGEVQHISKSGKNSVTKVMFSKREQCGYNPNLFDKNLFIVRDPRDILVSAILYRFNDFDYKKHKVKFDALMSAFIRKEANPSEVSIISILDIIGGNEKIRFFHAFATLLSNYSEYMDQETDSRVTIFKYEDFVDDKLKNLSILLTFNVDKNVQLDGWIKKIKRKGIYGDWKNWFTEEDIVFFKPALEGFISKYGYDNNWTLSLNPHIEKKYCSGYIKNLIAQQESNPINNSQNVTKELIINLESAAKDGKNVAMYRLGKMCIDGNKYIKKDKEKGVEYLMQSMKLGNVNAMHLLGLTYKKTDSKLAAKFFNSAIERNNLASFYEIGLIYNNIGDKNKAFECFYKGAQLGAKSCIRMVSTYLLDKEGDFFNLDEGQYWAKKYNEKK